MGGRSSTTPRGLYSVPFQPKIVHYHVSAKSDVSIAEPGHLALVRVHHRAPRGADTTSAEAAEEDEAAGVGAVAHRGVQGPRDEGSDNVKEAHVLAK